jgi:fructose-1,6-bisphosphatase
MQHVCKYACSEEVPEPVDVGGEGFCVAFDPLDGSSIVDTNFSVGTIFGVWPGDKLKDITGGQQVRISYVFEICRFEIKMQHRGSAVCKCRV